MVKEKKKKDKSQEKEKKAKKVSGKKKSPPKKTPAKAKKDGVKSGPGTEKKPKKAKKIIFKPAKKEVKGVSGLKKSRQKQKPERKEVRPPSAAAGREGAQKKPPVPEEDRREAVRPDDPSLTSAKTPEAVKRGPEGIEEIPASGGPGAPEDQTERTVRVNIPITVKELAENLGVSPNDLISKMITRGIFANINQALDEKHVKDAAFIYGVRIERLPGLEEEAFQQATQSETGDLVARAPVVTLMGHVDHGKTSLLDAVRKSKITDKEHGQITQHIGAYEVMLEGGAVTFLDTPGHEAFTAMRSRGANATDIVVLVVAADDGIKPQTVEAIDHAKAANVPIVVALNKCDLPHANIDMVKRQLGERDLLPEDWGGKTIVVEVSAKTGQGIDALLEMLLLEAELLELKADPSAKARGVVIESELSHGRGPVATVLVQTGTLRTGDVVVAGSYQGRIKAMINDRGENTKEAPPSMPVEILGLSGVPQAGDKFFAALDEKQARDYAIRRQSADKEKELGTSSHVSLAGLYKQIEKGAIKELKLIIKADVSGSTEALCKSLIELSAKYVKITIIHSGVGNINDSDVVLAHASNAIIIGFHVKVEPKAQVTAAKDGVEIKLYNIIYEAIADIKAAMEGMLEPITKEVFLGRAQVRQTFSVSKIGMVAGCYVVKGKIPRNAIVRLIRSGDIIYEGRISSLKRFKNDAREIQEGFECGLSLVNHNNIREGDYIEAYELVKISRRLDSK